MAPFFNGLDISEIKPGDHIYSWRKVYTYAHHGIYVGENQVIHFLAEEGNSFASSSSSPMGRFPCPNCPPGITTGIVKSCLECFLNGGRLCRYEYGLSTFRMSLFRRGTYTSVKSEPSAI
ncbi:hypothetical protein KI387_021819, partial [Taxus chinensis]